MFDQEPEPTEAALIVTPYQREQPVRSRWLGALFGSVWQLLTTLISMAVAAVVFYFIMRSIEQGRVVLPEMPGASPTTRDPHTSTPGVLPLGIPGASPTAVVQDFYMAANGGKYSEAEAMLAKETKDAISGLWGQLAGGLKGICDKNTKNGTITSIDPISEEIRGEGRTVVITIHFKDGSAKEKDKTGLIRRDGKWQNTLAE